jgi:glucose-6-phosphate dehydrogenase assembly protein OpcA
VIKKVETAMNAEKQDISREIVQSNKMGAEMEMEEEMEMEVDSTATSMELVLETEVDSTAKAMELVLEMKARRKWNLRPRQ